METVQPPKKDLVHTDHLSHFDGMMDRLRDGVQLDEPTACSGMQSLMSGEIEQGQIVEFLTAHSEREILPQVDEMVGFVRAMRDGMRSVELPEVFTPVIDTCGTGGDGKHTFNISTASSFVLAGAGVIVAKHGNRAASSSCGSADVLEALGIKLTDDPETVAEAMETAGIGFMFAPFFHPALKHVGAARKAYGKRTIFNFLGPLANPSGVTRQVIGVSDERMLPVLAQAAQRLGTQRTLLVHGSTSSIDEIDPTGVTRMIEVTQEAVIERSITPDDLFIPKGLQLAHLIGSDTAQGNAQIIEDILNGNGNQTQEAAVLMNAAAGLYIAGIVDTIPDAMPIARESISSGSALTALYRLKDITN